MAGREHPSDLTDGGAGDLAVRLLARLEELQDSATGLWPGDDEAAARQTNAAVVAALARLDLHGITGPLLARAVVWLERAGETTPPPEAETTAEQRASRLPSTDALAACAELLEDSPDDPRSKANASALLTAVRAALEGSDSHSAGPLWHAWALRLLAAQHGPGLREAVLEALWASQRAVSAEQERHAREQLESELAAVVRQSIAVDLSPPQRITGTRSRGELYRLRFGLAADAAGPGGVPLSAPAESLRLIVKKGSPDALARAIRRYSALPESLKALFARHAESRAGLQAPPGYLIMQDLADMQPLSEVLAAFDRAPLSAPAQARLMSAVAVVAATLRALHAWERRPSPVGGQAGALYLTPMIHSLTRLIQPGAFPEFAAWLAEGAQANGRALNPFDDYANRLAAHEARLRAPALGYVHGDCHSRNLMLDAALASARLVDIETLAGGEDYIADYGLLIEDLAVYQSLPYGDEPGRLAWREIELGPGARIRFPAFPQRSQAAVLFQRGLLNEVEHFAKEAGDAGWRERLWLAVARGLLLLASRQLASQPVHPYRRGESLLLAGAACAEALRLLDELAAHLEGAAPLPEVPFGGQ